MILLDDIFVHFNDDMPAGAREAVCSNPDGTYTVLINGDLTKEEQTAAFWHAVRHIQHNDFERVERYGIQTVETEAHKEDRYAEGKKDGVREVAGDRIRLY